MANTKQAKKMIRKIKRRTSYNRMWKLRVKEAIKSLDEVLAQANPNPDDIQKKYIKFQKTVDKASKNKVIHRNKRDRLKSKISRRLGIKSK